MNEYIKKDKLIKAFYDEMQSLKDTDRSEAADKVFRILIRYINSFEAADVQPLSVVAEHIKTRLYETAFNTNDAVTRNTIVDIASRIDFWINELNEDNKGEIGVKNHD